MLSKLLLFICCVSLPLEALKRDYSEHYGCNHHRQYLKNELVERYIHLIPHISTCNKNYCNSCNRKTSFQEEENSDAPEDPDVHEVCCCVCQLLDLNFDYNSKEVRAVKQKNWRKCGDRSIYEGYYFKWAEGIYSKFFQEYLQYCDINKKCKCFWPEISSKAAAINNKAYDLFFDLFEHTPLRELREREFQNGGVKNFHYTSDSATLQCIYRTFLFSHYYRSCNNILKITKKDLSHSEFRKVKNKIYDILDNLCEPFLDLYNDCLSEHANDDIKAEKKFIEFLLRKPLAESLTGLGKNPNPKAMLTKKSRSKKKGKTLEKSHSRVHRKDNPKKKAVSGWLKVSLELQRAIHLNETLQYNQAIEILNQIIEKNPKYLSAYLERAYAYFEIGEYEKAIEDYRSAKMLGYKSTLLEKSIDENSLNSLNRTAFAAGVTVGAIKGLGVATYEFIPSTLSTVTGIGQGLWALANDPKNVTLEFIDNLCLCIQFIKDNSTSETMQKIIPELKELIHEWDKFSDYEKGSKAGYIVGKYGVDIFGCGLVFKGVKYYRNLRRANTAMTLEFLETRPPNSEIRKLLRERRANQAQVLKNANLQFHEGRVGKHVKGHQNYKSGNSIFEHNNPEILLKKCGTGKRVNNVEPGMPGYKEVVDFGEHIGYYVNEEEKIKIATTKGTIHYSKEGIHIVPTHPNNSLYPDLSELYPDLTFPKERKWYHKILPEWFF